ncbi:MAG TPA: hypothetical protein VKW04_19800 [Planctomycetota bacterium]|nr:hypothetical protein [Planctomycetota bacterium]
MNRLLLGSLILLAAGCADSGSPGEKMNETDFETKIASALVFDPSLIKTGDRVVYFVKRSGDSQTQTYTWTAVAEEPGAVWIENKVPFDPRAMIVKTKLDRTGKTLEQWIGEPGGIPGKTYPNSRQTGSEPKPVRDSSSAKADSKEVPETIVVGGHSYACTRVTTNLVYPDGRKSTMVNWFSQEVPFAASKALGGLVRRQFGRLQMELVAGDRNGKPELVIPPQEK